MTKTNFRLYPIRYCATICVEAATPLSIGSGREGIITDRLVATSALGLPYIPGTSLAGVLRHALMDFKMDEETIDSIFGFANGEKGQGSRLTFSSAHLVLDDKKVADGLVSVDENITAIFQGLPNRDHVRLTERGTAADKGKYEEEVVHKGARFVFSMELDGSEADQEPWNKMLAFLRSPQFRIGGGTRKGFGELRVGKANFINYDLNNPEQLKAYLQRPATLSYPSEKSNWPDNAEDMHGNRYQAYNLDLTPRDFFFFGGETADEDVDDTYKTEKVIEYADGGTKLQLSGECVLIPASSVKGALRHRVAFHYNLLKGKTIKAETGQPRLDYQRATERLKDLEAQAEVLTSVQELKAVRYEIDKLEAQPLTIDATANLSKTEENLAVTELFGSEKGGSKAEGQRGRVLFSDVYLKKAADKVFDHVKIDAYTGGARDGALFQEKTVDMRPSKQTIHLNLYVHTDAFKEPQVREALEAAINDLTNGRLPLGGRTTKGHGFFKGNLQNSQ